MDEREKMNTDSNLLTSILARLVRIAPSKATLPVLECVVFSKNAHAVWATDLESTLWLPLDVDFDLCVPARLLADVAKNAQGAIELTADESTLVVKAGKSRSEIRGIPIGDAPMSPVLPDEGWQNFELLASIPKVAFAALKDVSRPTLQGVLVGQRGMAAADGVRLAAVGEIAGESVIVPASALGQVPALFPDGCEFCIGLSRIWFRGNGVVFTSQLIEGNYPNVDQIIPKKCEVEFTFKAKDVLRALNTVLVLSDQTSIVTFSPLPDMIRINAHNENGEAFAEFAAKGCGFEEFALNGRFLRDAMAVMENVTMGLNSPNQPVLLTEGDYKHVIMPMAMRGK